MCDWADPVKGCPDPSRIGDTVYYQRHVKQNKYFIERLTKGYVLKEWKRLEADTPEGWLYDPDPLWGEKHHHDDETGGVAVQTVLRRKPRTPTERNGIRAKMPHLPWEAVRALAKPDCPYGCKEGTVEVSDYPDDPVLKRLTHSETCGCVHE